MIIQRVYLRCDGNHLNAPEFVGENMADIRAKLKDHSWSTVKDPDTERHYCPKCIKQGLDKREKVE